MLRIPMMEQKNIQKIVQGSLEAQFLDEKYLRTRSATGRKTNHSAMNKFKIFLRIEKNLEENRELEQIKFLLVERKNLDPLVLLKEYYKYLRNCTTSKGKPLRNGPVRTYIIIAKEILRFLGCKIYNEDFKQAIRLPPKQDTAEEEIEKEELRILLRNSPLDLQAVILEILSGGMRIEELVQITLDDIDFTTNPITISLREEIVKGKIKPRKTQITGEAGNILKEYLTKEFSWPNWTKPNKFIFMRTHQERIQIYERMIKDEKVKLVRRNSIKNQTLPKIKDHLKNLNEQQLYDKCVENAKNNLEHKLERVVDSIPTLSGRLNNNVRKIHFHALRAWFKTTISDQGYSNFGEALEGRESVELRYYRKNDKKRRALYLKVETALTISDYSSIEKNITKTTEDYNELKEQFNDLKEKFEKYVLAKNS